MLKYFLLLSLVLAGACSYNSSHKKYPIKHQKTVEDETELVISGPWVDLLFVIDNSGSMETHQNNLASNINLLVGELFNNKIVDFNIGVLTTDDYDGNLIGNPRIITRNTINASDALRRNLLVGTSGGGTESVITPVFSALSPGMINPNTGNNRDFYRKNALLAVVMVTDAEDQGSVSAEKLQKYLLDLKNGNKDKLVVFGVIVPSGTLSCKRDDEKVSPIKIESFLKLIGGKSFSLCAPDYGAQLTKFGEELEEKVARKIPLSRLPKLSTIQVVYGDYVIPNDPGAGWVYDPRENAIILAKDIKLPNQPEGTRLEVHFEPF